MVHVPRQLTTEEAIIEAYELTWDQIAPDILGRDETASVDRDTVMDCCADHVRIHGAMSKEVEAAYKLLSWEEKKRLLRKAFPHKTYGY